MPWARHLWLVAVAGAIPAGALDGARVTSLELEGNRHFSDRELYRVMTTSPRPWRGARYLEAALDSDLNALLAVYEDAGFLDARIAGRQVIPAPDSASVRVVVQLEEGPRTRVSSLRVDGAEAISEAEIRRVIRLREGSVFHRQSLLADRQRLETLYAEAGRIDTEIAFEAVVDSTAAARLEVRIVEGPPVRVAAVRLDGLQKTRPHVVLRELALDEGDVMRRSLLEKTQTAVFSTGLFRSVVVSPAGERGQPTRDLRVSVRERDAGSLDVGVGYGSSERFRAGLALAHTNWRGKALRVGANTRASRLLRTVEGVFTVPFLFGRRVALDGRLFFLWDRNRQAAFRTRRTGTEQTFSYMWRNSWVSEVVYKLERVRFKADVADIYQEGRTTSSVALGMRRDSRDNLLDSRAGSLIRTRLEVAGGLLGGDSDFLRGTVQLLHFRRLFGPVLAVHVRASGINAAGVATRVATYEQFFLGGDRSVRGFDRGEIGADRIGELALSTQTELRVPVRGHGLVLFTDAGQVWTDLSDVSLPDDLRRAYGAGLRYSSRFGLLRLDLALADEPGPVSDRFGFYIGVGQAF